MFKSDHGLLQLHTLNFMSGFFLATSHREGLMLNTTFAYLKSYEIAQDFELTRCSSNVLKL